MQTSNMNFGGGLASNSTTDFLDFGKSSNGITFPKNFEVCSGSLLMLASEGRSSRAGSLSSEEERRIEDRFDVSRDGS